MGLIVKKLTVQGDKGKNDLEVFFDSGARRSVIRKDAAEKIASLQKSLLRRTFTLADNKTQIHSEEVTVLWITIDGKTIDDEFYVVSDLSRELIVGASTMQTWDILLDLKNEKVTVGVDPGNIELF